MKNMIAVEEYKRSRDEISYYIYQEDELGFVYSIDKVICKFEADDGFINDLKKLGLKWDGRENDGNRYVCIYRIDGEAIRIEIIIKKNYEDDGINGYVRFNPNKLFRIEEIRTHAVELISSLICVMRSYYFVAYDLAIDIPIAKMFIYGLKDKRLLSYYDVLIETINKPNSSTMYYGRRQKDGNVKIYDKSDELDLPRGWTRIELTLFVNDNPSIDSILRKIPRIYAVNDSKSCTNKLNATLSVLIKYLNEDINETKTERFQELTMSTQKQLLPYLNVEPLGFDQNCIYKLINEYRIEENILLMEDCNEEAN